MKNYHYLFLLIGLVLVSVSTSGLAQVVATIPVGSNPEGIVISSNGHAVYVANTGSNTVSVIDTKTNTVTFTIPVNYIPFTLALTPDGRTLYVLEEPNGYDLIVAINSVTKGSVGSMVAGGGGDVANIAITPDGKYLYSINEVDETIDIFDTSTNQGTGFVSTSGGRPFALVFSPDGMYAYVLCAIDADATTEGILRIDTSTLGKKQLAWGQLSEAENGSVVISPDGKKLYIGAYAGGGTIEVYDISEGALEPSISVAGDFAGAITPNGKYLYCPDRASSNVYVVNRATGQLHGTPISLVIAPGLGELVIGQNGKYGYILSGNNVAVIAVAGRIK